MANGVNGPVHGVEPPPPYPPVDRVLAQPQRHELSAGNHPMLPPRKLRNPPVEGVLFTLTAHYAVKSKGAPVRPLGVASGRA